MLSERSQWSLLGNTEMNPKEQVKAVTLRNGRELQFNKYGETPIAMKENMTADKSEAPKEDDKSSPLKVKANEPEKTKAPIVQPYKPPLPYPARLRKDKDQEHFDKFLNLFK